jgi:ABC-type polysaccharide/polyol phosphate export permease
MNQQHIGLMFSMLITAMIFFGCTYYPWSTLKTFPILQRAVLINPLVYASEGMRATLVPQLRHLLQNSVGQLKTLLRASQNLTWNFPHSIDPRKLEAYTSYFQYP